MIKRLLLVTLATCWLAPAQSVPVAEKDYRIFRSDGTPASLKDIIEAARAVQVTFLGESHDDPVGHFVELEVLKQLAKPGLALSLEMFERDAQPVLDEYLHGIIPESFLISDGRAWPNYRTDYRPLVDFAKQQKLPVIAANAPRRYVNRVGRLGKGSLQDLSPEDQKTVAPLPYAEASPAYTEAFDKIMAESHQPKKGEPADPEKEKAAQKRALESQSLWDATMADSIAKYLKQAGPDARVVHVNGRFHTDHHRGIIEHLERYQPGVKTLVISMEPRKSFPKWDPEMAGSGDFIVITDPALTKAAAKAAKKKKR